MSKKILMIEPCFEGFGGYHRAYNIALEHARSGDMVELLVSANHSSYVISRNLGANLKIISLPRRNKNFLFNGRFLRGMLAAKYIFQNQYDLIHIFALIQIESWIPFFATKILRRKNVVVDWDDYWSGIHKTIPFYKNYLFGIPILYFKFFELFIQRAVGRMTVTSDFLLKKARDLGIQDVYKIINAIDGKEYERLSQNEARKKLEINNDQLIILAFGNTFFSERSRLLLHFSQILLARSPDAKIFINLPLSVIVQENCPELSYMVPACNNIVNIGYLDKLAMSSYTAAADYLLFLAGSSSYEKACFPIRIGSYINASKRVLFNDVDTEASRFLIASHAGYTSPSLHALVDMAVENRCDYDEEAFNKSNEYVRNQFSWSQQVAHLRKFLFLDSRG